MAEEYESVCLVKPEVFVYRIPPLTSNRGYKAADWKLDEPNWTGRMRLVAIGDKLEMRLEDKASGQLFAKCPIDRYPGVSIEPVLDSSRYFVVRLKNDNGQTAFIGLGFSDRSDSFDLNVALQEHFKYVEKKEGFNKEQLSDQPKLDLGFKEGQTITINFGVRISVFHIYVLHFISVMSYQQLHGHGVPASYQLKNILNFFACRVFFSISLYRKRFLGC
ncbi:unnamed protein product [Thelazia callipaeda]|uniref:DUF1681 domain-containing protein n=1 Tax=Thelazia callipaeda TaxID=103827 RepID=A0A0N5D7G3_THECL|nr:unnamed protein product [Thelazia callipaeda]